MGESRRAEQSQKGEAGDAGKGKGGSSRGEADRETNRGEGSGRGLGGCLAPRQEARSGPARCPGGQMHSKEPSVLVQMPLWQRSSSLHSSTSAGQCWQPQATLLACLTFQTTPLHRLFPAPMAPRL